MRIREALFQTLDTFKISGKQLSADSGVTESQISSFRRGNRELDLKNFEKLVEALPPNAYHHFWTQLALKQLSDDHLCELIMMAATHLKDKQPGEVLVLNGRT
jgi:transcriptional regulator with XRE-family HTH domain